MDVEIIGELPVVVEGKSGRCLWVWDHGLDEGYVMNARGNRCHSGRSQTADDNRDPYAYYSRRELVDHATHISKENSAFIWYTEGKE